MGLSMCAIIVVITSTPVKRRSSALSCVFLLGSFLDFIISIFLIDNDRRQVNLSPLRLGSGLPGADTMLSLDTPA